MAEQIDLWPDTVMTQEKALEEKIKTYMSMWKADPSVAILSLLRNAIDDRMQLERRITA